MERQDSSFEASSRMRFWLLLVGVVCQLATILITWPLWELRQTPPHLPLFNEIHVPFGALMVISLSIVVIRPKVGVVVHVVVYAAACLVDQYRLQPQVMALILLMFAVTFESMGRFVRWWLASLWVWAGLHKLLSAYWWGPASATLLSRIDGDLSAIETIFAASVACGEIGLGILAIVRPKWAAIGCPLVHGGIIVFLSPLGIAWNYSVIPWNLATAIVGCWLLQQAWVISERRRWEAFAVAVLMVAPAGFYLSWVDHGIAAVLYSDCLPMAVVTQESGSHQINGWGDLHVPFPNERRLYRTYFAQVGEPGDKMHILDPRPWLSDEYLLIDESHRVVEISRERFFRARSGEVTGVAVDDPLAVFKLKRAGAVMKKREEDSPVFAIVFPPQHFEPQQLELIQRLPNLEQVLLARTSVTDDDLAHLSGLPKLQGIGLDGTAITDEGLLHLEECPELIVVEARQTKISPRQDDEPRFRVVRD